MRNNKRSASIPGTEETGKFLVISTSTDSEEVSPGT
jgi:hypothetical protein